MTPDPDDCVHVDYEHPDGSIECTICGRVIPAPKPSVLPMRPRDAIAKGREAVKRAKENEPPELDGGDAA